MDFSQMKPSLVLHWNYRGFTEFPIQQLSGEESDITDIYLKENLISKLPCDIGKLESLVSLYLSGNDIVEVPKEISQLRCLKCLDVSGNRLRRLPDEIGEVRSLKFLILDENELSELPLRIAELKALRYLSVCDNKLEWLPQRPVYNYHHCEFRFWRNPLLKSIPYSLWYHMFRGQQTRSFNIGCLTVSKYHHSSKQSRFRLKLRDDSREWELNIECPSYHTNILKNNTPPSLSELCKRKFYQVISDAAKKLSTIDNSFANYENYNGVNSLQSEFNHFNISNENEDCDLNGNELRPFNNIYSSHRKQIMKRQDRFPADVIEEHFDYLPKFIKQDLSNGPVSKCEICKKPVFDYVFYEFCFGKIILIENMEDIILSAIFCSKSCTDLWKRGRTNLIPWTLVEE